MALEILDFIVIGLIVLGGSILVGRSVNVGLMALAKNVKVPRPVLVGGLPPELVKDKELREWILELAKIQAANQPAAQQPKGQLGQLMELARAYGGKLPGAAGLLGQEEEAYR